jgi:putative heme-binding domain-containing protein
MDWYDKYPCYQNANADPEGVDRTHGRIWRVVHTGDKSGVKVPSHPEGMNLAKLSSEELARTLKHANVWQRRTAQRVLSDRARAGTDLSAVRPILKELFSGSETQETRMAALWTAFSAGLLTEEDLDNVAGSDLAPARAWAARFTGERGEQSEQIFRRLYKLSTDSDASVKLAVATALRQFVSGNLTINTPPANPPVGQGIALVLSSLVKQPDVANDPVLPFMTWMALEPLVERSAPQILGWFVGNGVDHPEMSAKLLYKIARRLCDTQDAEKVGWLVTFLEKTPKDSAPILRATLDGVIEGQRGKVTLPAESKPEVLSTLMQHSDKEVASRAQRLGAMWGDTGALRASIAVLESSEAQVEQRVATVQALRQIKASQESSTMIRNSFLKLVGSADERLAVEAIRGIGEVGGQDVPNVLLANWRQYSPAKQRATAEVLTSRREWTQEFLGAIENKKLSASELPAPVVRSLMNSKDEMIRTRASKAIGRVREANADKLKVIAAKKAVVMNGPVNLERGHELAKQACFTCHKLYGEGGEVGPDLTGVGRATLDALLNNVIDPNQIVGAGYENVEIETKDGRNVSGRLIEETDSRIKLLSAGPKEEVIAKSDIASKKVSELSVMPEGLENMEDADFRNLMQFILRPPQERK